jgi:hypothetical protein
MLSFVGAAAGASFLFTWTNEEVAAAAQATQAATAAGQKYTPRFFNAHEYTTLVALADMILPKDNRSVKPRCAAASRGSTPSVGGGSTSRSYKPPPPNARKSSTTLPGHAKLAPR